MNLFFQRFIPGIFLFRHFGGICEAFGRGFAALGAFFWSHFWKPQRKGTHCCSFWSQHVNDFFNENYRLMTCRLQKLCNNLSLWPCPNHSFGSDGYGWHLGWFGRDLGKVLEMFGDSCQQAWVPRWIKNSYRRLPRWGGPQSIWYFCLNVSLFCKAKCGKRENKNEIQ